MSTIQMQVVFIILSLCFAGRTMAQPVLFESLTIEHGLSQGMIFDILQTRDGFLWIATKDGLNRYDGYNFKVFTNDPFDPFSLAENTVVSLFEDSRGWLWIGTESKGLDVYNPKTGRFHHFNLNAIEINSVVKVESGRIRETSDGTIWAIRTVLARIPIPSSWKNGLPDEPDLGKLCQVSPFPISLAKSPSEDWLIDFALLKNDELLVTSKHEHFLVDTRKNTFKSTNQGLLPKIINRFEVADVENSADVWMGSHNEIWRIRHGKTTSFPTTHTTTLVQRMYLKAGENGHIWVVINNQIWDIAPGEDIDFSNPDFVVDLPSATLISDRNDNLWLGTLGYGLRKINPAKSFFHAGGTGTSISGLWRSSDGRYFCKSYNNIYPYNPKSGQINRNAPLADAFDFQINMVFGPSGDLWVLCKNNDMGDLAVLQRFGPNGKLLESFTFEAKLNLLDQLIFSRDGHLWISGYGCQMVQFDPRTGKIRHFSFAHLFGEKASTVRTTALVEAPDGVFWAGTQLGLVKCIKNGQGIDFQIIKADVNNRQGLNNNSIACILPDSDGSIWLGTKGGGINWLDQKTGIIRHITTADGLPNNVVYGILQDSKNNLWCSTNRGVAKINVPALSSKDGRGGAITTFTAAMGLQDNEFNTGAFFKAENGEMLFGGVNGLNRFFPEDLQLDTTPPSVLVVGLNINHQPAHPGSLQNPLPAPIELLRQLNLGYDQNNLSFEFAALDFTDPAKNRYRYRLVGLDADWVHTGGHRFAHFTHLAPGKYTLRVQANNGESAWSEMPHPIEIIIIPPWWRSHWAYVAYLSLLAWGGWRVYQLQIKRVKEREQLAFEQRETERIKALEQLKTNFFSNVTHEFRTPLTLIIEPLRQLLKNPDDPDRTEKIHLAEKNSQQLLLMVNQLLDLSKLESGSMMLDLRRANLGDTVRNAMERFFPLAEKRGVKLLLKIEETSQHLYFDFDPNKVELVLNNLISNALKFTPSGGQVSIGMAHSPSVAEVKIMDTGIGIAWENLEKIFDRFYQVDGTHTRMGEGTGIGLSLSKEMAVLMGGGLSVESELGKGSTFTFWLPLRNLSSTVLDKTTIESEQTTVFQFLKNENGVSNGEKPVALVVEDNAALRHFIKISLFENWQVIEASDGEEGIQKAIELVPDIVVSDLMMPRKDGFEVCNELKNNELTSHIPIVLLTAKSNIESKLSGLRHGADDYLTKPFSTEELLLRMENLVENRRRLRQIFGTQASSIVMGQESLDVKSGTTSVDFLSEPDSIFLKKFISLVEENLENGLITIEDLSKKMFLSRSQLHRKIKALTDQSPTDFVRNYRLDRAYTMLKNHEGRVGEIAIRVGFGSEKYFSTAFKEKFGVPPSQV